MALNMINVPPLDLTQQYEIIEEQVNTRVQEVLSSGRYIVGVRC